MDQIQQQINKKSIQEMLEDVFNSRKVYYQPPENVKMEYPAIRYSKSDITSDYADNKKYSMYDVYDVVVIDRKPDNPVIKKLLQLDYSSFIRHYVADNLNHDIIRIYY